MTWHPYLCFSTQPLRVQCYKFVLFYDFRSYCISVLSTFLCISRISHKCLFSLFFSSLTSLCLMLCKHVLWKASGLRGSWNLCAYLHLGGLLSLGPNMCLIQFKEATGVGPQSILLNNERPISPDTETRQACLSLSLLNVTLLSTFTKGYWTNYAYLYLCVCGCVSGWFITCFMPGVWYWRYSL